MKILLIVNATASSVTSYRRTVIEKALAADHELTVVETSRRGHATALAQQAATDGTEVVAVLAGDGTLNEAAQGMLHSPASLAPLPGGSTNVYARTVGYVNDPIEATGQLLAALDHNQPRRVGVGDVNGRVFLCHAGLGFDAAVIEQVEKMHTLKRFFAHPLVVATAFDTWFRRYDHRHNRFQLRFASHDKVEEIAFVVISKTSPYTYLGHRPIILEDSVGLNTPLALTAFRSIEWKTMVPVTVSALANGRVLRRHRRIVHRTGVEKLRIESPKPIPYQVDGDYLGDLTTFDVSYSSHALSLMVP